MNTTKTRAMVTYAVLCMITIIAVLPVFNYLKTLKTGMDTRAQNELTADFNWK